MFVNDGETVLLLKNVDIQEGRLHHADGAHQGLVLRFRTALISGEPATFPPLAIEAKDLEDLATLLLERARQVLATAKSEPDRPH